MGRKALAAVVSLTLMSLMAACGTASRPSADDIVSRLRKTPGRKISGHAVVEVRLYRPEGSKRENPFATLHERSYTVLIEE